jgi:restriction endonuclease S subunit
MEKTMNWEMTKLGDTLSYEQPTKYIVTSDLYDNNFSVPVLTAGKSFILGYTDENNGIYTNLPAIIFDDFTTETKYVDFEFKVKSSAMKILTTDDKVADLRFLFHLLSTLKIDSSQHKRYWISKFAPYEVPLPPLPIQKQITEILDKADTLRKKGKQLLQYYDDLAQSLFIDMFGDPVKNEKKWDRLKVGDVSKSKLGKMLDEKKYTGTSLYKYLGNSNVLWHDFNLSNLKEIDFTNEERVKYSLENGDVLMCEGGDAGRCAIWKSDIANTFFQKAIHRIRLDPSIIGPNYFVWMMYFFSKKEGLKTTLLQPLLHI